MKPMLLWLLTASTCVAQGDSLWTSVLKDHVVAGRVNYRAVKQDARFWTYVESLRASSDQDYGNRDDQLAYWCNVYNAFTVKLICDHYPVESIKDLNAGSFLAYLFSTTVWDREVVTLRGRTLTLNQVEHEIVRPKFKDFRVHFALVCAAKGCPPLRSEAYVGSRVSEQLDHQARVFVQDRKQNSFDASTGTLRLSSLFKWYLTDFGATEADLIQSLLPYFSDDVKNQIAAVGSKIKVSYLDYDWRLNE